MIFIRKFYIKCMRGKRFEEKWPGRSIGDIRHVCHQCYVRADKSGTALTRACEVCS